MTELNIIPGWAGGGGVKYLRYPYWRQKHYSVNECNEKYGDSADIIGHRNNNHPNWVWRNTCYAIKNPTKNTRIYTWPSYKNYPIDEPLPNEAVDNVHTMACTNGGKIENLCKGEDYYVNPLGDVKPLDYKNNVSKSIKNYNTRNGQLEDSNEKINIANIELIAWSTGLGISLIILLLLLRNINK